MRKKRLLLIEDDFDVAEMLLMYFQSHQYEVLHADNGVDGIELARTRFPNLILLDVMLPYMDGYDVCVKLRQIALTKYIPILFLTQRDERAAKVRGLELGVDDYITKPFDIDELRLRVQRAIERATRENLHEGRTGLPTGPMIEEELAEKLAQKQQSGTAFMELVYRIEDFQPFEDKYGFMAANDVLNHAAATIKTVTSEMGTTADFVGIQNDDFVLLTQAEDVDHLDNVIKQRFAEEVRAFYSFVDADRGGILAEEGTAGEHVIPLMRLSSFSTVH
ncbi:MAG: response regulator [Anaerolineae bacterium]